MINALLRPETDLWSFSSIAVKSGIKHHVRVFEMESDRCNARHFFLVAFYLGPDLSPYRKFGTAYPDNSFVACGGCHKPSPSRSHQANHVALVEPVSKPFFPGTPETNIFRCKHV